MAKFIDYLERRIEGCDSLGGMEREKAIYQSVLKDYRKQFAISDVVEQSEQLVSFLRQYQKTCEILHVNKIDAKNFVEQYKTN